MAIYDKPVWSLMWDMVKDLGLAKDQMLSKEQVNSWFSKKYPKIKTSTIAAHLIRMSTNASTRVYYKAKQADDLFFQVDGSHFRLYQPGVDPPPIYEKTGQTDVPAEGAGSENGAAVSEFAYENDLKNFLAKNLSAIEPGLKLYEEEGITGVEFPAGGRFIDILAIDSQNNYVVIELKVSKGYDKAVGQLLRYMGWVAKNHAESSQKVRGIIVAREISDDLLLACSSLAVVDLFEYSLSVSVKKVNTISNYGVQPIAGKSGSG
jgi:endonuclease